jgi:hypothetical protein
MFSYVLRKYFLLSFAKFFFVFSERAKNISRIFLVSLTATRKKTFFRIRKHSKH